MFGWLKKSAKKVGGLVARPVKAIIDPLKEPARRIAGKLLWEEFKRRLAALLRKWIEELERAERLRRIEERDGPGRRPGEAPEPRDRGPDPHA